MLILLTIKWFLIFLILFVLFHTIMRIIRHIINFPAPAFVTRMIDNPFRRKFVQKPDVIASRMMLKPGMTVLDIGPGKGSYTKAVAEKVLPEGRVYAIDIQEKVIDYLNRRIEKEQIPNIMPSIGNVYDLSFSDASIDRILLIACLPEIPDKIRALKELRRVLKADGIISLCELFPDPDYPFRSTEKKWAGAANLKLVSEYGNWFAYQLNFRIDTDRL